MYKATLGYIVRTCWNGGRGRKKNGERKEGKEKECKGGKEESNEGSEGVREGERVAGKGRKRQEERRK